MNKTYSTIMFVVVALIALSLPPYVVAQQGDAEALSVQLREGAESCCAPFGGFTVTDVIVARTTDGVPCVNCLPGAAANHIAVPFPEAVAFVGVNWSYVVTLHSQIPGPCTAVFLLFSVALNQVIDGNSVDIADCGSNTLRLINFFNNPIPNAPGNAVAVGLVQASNGTVSTGFEQFVIQ